MLALISKKDDRQFIRKVLTSIENRELIEAGAKTPELEDFRRYFSLGDPELRSAFMAGRKKQALADAGIMRFWLEVGKTFAEKKAVSPIHMLEGHERAGARQDSLKQNGFYFDWDCRMRYKELLKKRKGELATVMIAKRARTSGLRMPRAPKTPAFRLSWHSRRNSRLSAPNRVWPPVSASLPGRSIPHP